MPLRKASAYTKKKGLPYTRKSRIKNKNYIKTDPAQIIIRFRMGDKSGYEKGELKNIIKVVSGERVMIRDNALEACRKSVLRNLEKKIPGFYYLEVKVYPHHILRENKVYSGASKGERVNTGMAQSFGKVIGRAASVKANQTIFVLALKREKDKSLAISALKKIKAKLPCHTRLLVEKKK